MSKAWDLRRCVGWIKACKDAEDLRRAHAEIARKGSLQGIKGHIIATTLISGYAKCGAFAEARELLEIPLLLHHHQHHQHHHLLLQVPASQDITPWNALIAGYVERGRGEEAMRCLEELKREGRAPNAATYSCILKACGLDRDRRRGKRIHEEVLRHGLLLNNNLVEGGGDGNGGGGGSEDKNKMVLGASLVGMYVKWGDLGAARRALQALRNRNVVTWTCLAMGYAQQKIQKQDCFGAFDSLARMQAESSAPNLLALASVVKASASIEDASRGKQMHAMIAVAIRDREEQNKRIGSNTEEQLLLLLGSSLVSMYAKCGMLSEARRLLLDDCCGNAEIARDVVAWNALVSGYAHRGRGVEAVAAFERMKLRSILPDAFSFASALNACGRTLDLARGKRIHGQMMIMMMLLLSKEEDQQQQQQQQQEEEVDVVLGNALVDMYARCGDLESARRALRGLRVRNAASWNALIAGSVRNRSYLAAFDCFDRMRSEARPDSITFLCILQACGRIGAMHKGTRLHGEIASAGLLQHSMNLGNALIGMYARSDLLALAHRVLEDELPVRDAASWNTLISAYARRGQTQEAMCCFEHLRCEGLRPSRVSFAAVLNALARSGLSAEARAFFSSSFAAAECGCMGPTIQHYGCLLMASVCIGDLDSALALIKLTRRPWPDRALWVVLLGACNKWGNAKLGKLAFDRARSQANDPIDPSLLPLHLHPAAGL
jgi:pentatricopeptide repeat protein